MQLDISGALDEGVPVYHIAFYFFKEMAMPHGFVTHFLMSPVEFKKAACA